MSVRPELWIAGEWRTPKSGETYDIENPATGTVIGQAASASVEDVADAVAAAREAADDGRWSGLPARTRSQVLIKAAGLLRERLEDFAQAESLNVGKPISLARAVDVSGSADQLEYYGALAQTLEGSTKTTPLPALAYTKREPHGVVAAITPFNFPLVLTISKIAPALAAGNTVVHKPAPLTPMSAQLLAELLTDAGVPAGVYNLVTGPSPESGDALVRDPGVDAITFTGSTAVGSMVASTAGKQLKPVATELGGNGPNLLFADADLDRAIGAVINSFVFNTGQFCMAGPRLLVERPVYETVIGILADAVGKVPLGRPSDESTVIGPLASAAQRARVERFVASAQEQGGRLVAGGTRIELDGGYYFPPTVIADLPNDATAIQEEVFGPVLTVQPFDSEEEAITMANSTPYGLAAGVQTGNIARAHRVADRLQAGMVWVNDWAMLDPSLPFGGVKSSGWGRENGPEAFASYTRTKSVVVSLQG